VLLKNAELGPVLVKRSISVKPTTSLLEAREIMFRHKIKRLVVLGTKDKPLGIITEKDVARTVYNLGNKSIKSVRVGDFMSKKLVTVTKNNTVYDCAKLMKNKKIGSVLVLNSDGTLAGIITKTDLVSVFLTQATGPLKVSDIMTKKVISVTPNDTILLVESLLINHRLTRIVVQRNQRPVGIITHRDFVPAKIPRWLADAADPKEVQDFRSGTHLTEFNTNQLAYLLPFKAIDIMTANPVTIDAKEDVSVAALLMIRHNISGLPVVRKSNLVGLITKSDIVNAIASH
jgi:CBS domain-containing protein